MTPWPRTINREELRKLRRLQAEAPGSAAFYLSPGRAGSVKFSDATPFLVYSWLAANLAPSLLKDYYCRGLVASAKGASPGGALAEIKALQARLGVAVDAPPEEAAALAAIGEPPAKAVESCQDWLQAQKKATASEDKPDGAQAGLVVQDVPEPAGRPVDDEQAPPDREKKPSSGGAGGLSPEKVKDGAMGAVLGGGLFGIAAGAFF